MLAWGVDPWWVYSVSFRFPFFGVPFGFDESLGEWASMRVEVIGEVCR